MEKLKQSVNGLCMLLLISLLLNMLLVATIFGIVNHNEQEDLTRRIMQEECMPDETPSMNTKDFPPLEVIEDLK